MDDVRHARLFQRTFERRKRRQADVKASRPAAAKENVAAATLKPQKARKRAKKTAGARAIAPPQVEEEQAELPARIRSQVEYFARLDRTVLETDADVEPAEQQQRVGQPAVPTPPPPVAVAQAPAEAERDPLSDPSAAADAAEVSSQVSATESVAGSSVAGGLADLLQEEGEEEDGEAASCGAAAAGSDAEGEKEGKEDMEGEEKMEASPAEASLVEASPAEGAVSLAVARGDSFRLADAASVGKKRGEEEAGEGEEAGEDGGGAARTPLAGRAPVEPTTRQGARAAGPPPPAAAAGDSIYELLLSRAREVDRAMARELPAGYRFEECREWGHPGLAALIAQFAEEDPGRIGPSSAGAEPLGGQQHVLLLLRGTEAVGYAYGTRHHAGSLLDGPRLHHLFLRRDLRRKGLGLGRKLLLRWCEGVPPQYRAFGVNSPNELMRRVLGRLGGKHLAGHDERDGCGQSVGYYLLKQPE